MSVIIQIILLFILLKLIDSYIYYKKEDNNYVTNITDLYKYEKEGRYCNSKLYNKWKRLSSSDKIFIRDLICHELLNYKQNKPSFKKMTKSACKQLLGSTLFSSYVLSSPFQKALSQNSLGFFVSNII